MPSMSTLSKIGSTGMQFMGGMTGKTPPGGGDDQSSGGGSSWAQSAGQLVGGIMGTGGAESGSMAGMAGQMIGGAMGTKGGQDGSFGATVGQQAASLFGKGPSKEEGSGGGIGPGSTSPPGEQKQEEEKEKSVGEQLPGLVGSMMGETRVKGCWKKAYSRGFGHRPSVCGPNQSISGLWCFANCQDGYTGFSRTCYKDCPSETGSGWLGTCKRAQNYKRGPGDTKPCTGCEKIGLRYYEKCKDGYVPSGS